MSSSSMVARDERRGVGKPSMRSSSCLRSLENDETLLVQSGQTGWRLPHARPARRACSSANSLLVPAWANWENIPGPRRPGLTMYGQMTAGSWIYIGSQGIVQGTYETLAEVAPAALWWLPAGRLVVTAGLGGMGGAQPLAITMNGGVALIAEVDAAESQRRLESGYLDAVAPS